MTRRIPRSTLTYPLLPYTTPFRSLPRPRAFVLGPGDERREERVGRNDIGAASDHEPARERTSDAERAGPHAGRPAEGFGRLQDAAARVGRHAGAVVEREGHEPLAHARTTRDIRNSRSLALDHRSVERRVGKECVSTFMSRWCEDPLKKMIQSTIY